MRDVAQMNADFREAAAAEAVKTWDAGFRHGRELGAMQGAAVLGGLMGMAQAVAENDSVRACGHCGLASGSRAYCGDAMCDPAECFYWICRDCADAGRSFKAALVSGVTEPKEKKS